MDARRSGALLLLLLQWRLLLLCVGSPLRAAAGQSGSHYSGRGGAPAHSAASSRCVLPLRACTDGRWIVVVVGEKKNDFPTRPLPRDVVFFLPGALALRALPTQEARGEERNRAGKDKETNVIQGREDALLHQFRQARAASGTRIEPGGESKGEETRPGKGGMPPNSRLASFPLSRA